MDRLQMFALIALVFPFMSLLDPRVYTTKPVFNFHAPGTYIRLIGNFTATGVLIYVAIVG